MKITVLGCGSSVGTPAAGGFWGRCDPAEPRNRRNRASLLVQSDTTNILIDTTPDLRLQLNTHPVDRLDAVLLTHMHADHTAGLDDLRPLAFHNSMAIPLYCSKPTMDELNVRFGYLFRES